MADDLELRSSALERYFFTPLYHPSSPLGVIKWWESRRALFNVGVGATGLVSLGLSAMLLSVPPGAAFNADMWWAPVLVYGVMANVCYTMGAPVDLALRRLLGDRAAAVGPVLFRYGFVFSIGLTLLPVPIALLSLLFHVFGG